MVYENHLGELSKNDGYTRWKSYRARAEGSRGSRLCHRRLDCKKMAMAILFSLEFVFGAVSLVVAFREDGFRTSRCNAVQMFGGANKASLSYSFHLLSYFGTYPRL